MQEVYTPQEIAKMLKVSKNAVYQWLSQGRLKGFRVGDLWRIPKDALEEFIKPDSEGKE
ncbi:MAG TPA: helix-turn-helix domain-containing protein [Firmicutes bacterium]|nr:helix-turn-helix domain-containing protein [Bacillota bacterium]